VIHITLSETRHLIGRVVNQIITCSRSQTLVWERVMKILRAFPRYTLETSGGWRIFKRRNEKDIKYKLKLFFKLKQKQNEKVIIVSSCN